MARGGAVLGMEAGSFHYGSRRVFDDITFLLDDARSALVGENGAGKSTLLKCLTGELELNTGAVVRSRSTKVAALPQEVPDELSPLPVREVFARALERAGAAGEDWRIDVLEDEIGLPAAMAQARFGTLSGGWKRLCLIAAAARLESPDILLLDEPTNHLDIGHINTLERWLTETFAGLPMLVVSHDREFLNRVTSRTLFLRADGMHVIRAPFAAAREELIRRDVAAASRRRLEQKEISRLEQVAARYRIWGMKNPKLHKRAKAVETRIRHIEEQKTEVYQARERRLELAEGEIEARTALRIEDFTVQAPDGRALFRIDRLAIGAGDKVALLGPNGVGKTSLLSALAARHDPKQRHYDGRAGVRFNPACRLAVFEQTMAGLPLDETPLSFLSEAASEREAIPLLVAAGFPYARQRDPVAILSYGERARLMFLKMKLSGPNLYLLDEPTSHLDIEGQEDLETQLEEREVACLVVSHDRYFTRAAATRFLEIRRGRLVEVESADDFFDRQEAES